MSRQRSRASVITDEEINDLILKLQVLLPQLNQRQTSRVQIAKVLRETCSHMRKLHREVEDLSDKLCHHLDCIGANITDIDVNIIRRFLQQ